MTQQQSNEAPKSVRLHGLICAGGVGTRMQADRPKQYLELHGKTMLELTVKAMAQECRLQSIWVIVSPEDPYIDEVAQHFPEKVLVLKVGGDTRAKTVWNGLLNTPFEDEDWVLVHDAARPCLRASELAHLVDTVLADDSISGGILALPMSDTVKVVNDEGIIEKTIPRDHLWRAATPQMFKKGLLLQALNDPHEGITDEASAVEALGYPVKVIAGRPTNIKVTQPMDKMIASLFLGNESMSETKLPQLRVGQGYDSHRLVEGRDLIVGGIQIPHTKGLLGHSDADILLHAITDAVLGASGLGDIGEHFPPSDEQYKNADSARLLKVIVERAHAKGWRVVNCDSTIIAERPKMGPYRPLMKEKIAQLLEIDPDAVNIKAKTNEKMDAVGQEEGMVALATVLMARD